MRTMIRKIGVLFDRRAKAELLVATVGSVIVALLETTAIVMILPLVSLASGAPMDSGVLRWISQLLHSPSRTTLGLVLTLFVVGAFIVKDLAALAFSWWQTGVIQNQRVRTSVAMMRHFMGQSYIEHTRRTTADLLRTMNDSVAQVYSSAVNGGIQLVTASVTILAIGAALIVVAPLPTLALMGYLGLAGLAYARLMRPRSIAAGQQILDASVDAYSAAFHALGGFKEISLRGSAEHFIEAYATAGRKGARAARVANFVGVAPKYLMEILFIVAVGALLAIGFVRDGGASAVGTLALFVAAGFRLLPNLSGLMASIGQVRLGANALHAIHAELRSARVQDAPGPEPAPRRMSFHHELRLEDVSFRYPGTEADVLTDVSLRIPRGASVAFVGGSGAGKTTLVDLMLGLLTPTRGRLLADGVDIADDIAGWRANVGMVPQDVYLTDRSLAQNIAFDQRPEAIDGDRLREVIAQARLGELVDSLPQGIDTPVGERGVRLSGGQRQRIGIARALYRRPALLVLDEATSALDNETERRITETVDQLHGTVTLIQVAHRLSTVKRADLIVHLEDGRIQGIGTFTGLQQTSAGFRRLVELGSLASE